MRLGTSNFLVFFLPSKDAGTYSHTETGISYSLLIKIKTLS
jgi:hypothetical protein